MKLAVFGGSGVVGRVLLPVLIDRGHQVRALVHNTPLQTDGVETVSGGMGDPAAVAETIGDAEVVLQMTKGGAGIEQLVETSVRGTANILDCIQKSPAVRQYLLTSSDAAAGIWSHPHPAPISHATEPMSYGGYYSMGKVLEEVLLREYDRNGGVPHTIARLSYVHQEDSALKLFIAGLDPARPRGPFDANYSADQKQRLADGRRFVVLPVDTAGTPLRRTLVQREDVVDAMAAMVGEPKAIGQRFHISGPAFDYTVPCEYLSDKLNLPIEKVAVPDAHPFEIDTSLTTELLGWKAKYDVIAMLDAALAYRGKA
ncbi:MAG TPA: NAD(P)-dependent oxidoreductase [Phycisphaerae bacterium]|nr:NAD(P)-dependent oxidoreductase [Phycisphaerae bacterium]